MARKKRRAAPRITDTADPTDEIQGEDDVARKVLANWKASKTHLQKWKEEAKESYDFVAGVQWDEADTAKMVSEQRQPITFNRTGTTVDAVSGYEINGRQDVTFVPRTVEDNGPAGVESDAARYFRQECDAEDEESDAFYDALVCGLGVVEHRMDYDTNPDGMMLVERGDPIEFGWDPAAKKRNLVDRRWDVRGQWLDKEWCQDQWPDADFSDANEQSDADSDSDAQQPISVPENSFYRSGSGENYDKRKGKVFIVEMTWFELEPFYQVTDPATGKRIPLQPDQYKIAKKAADDAGGQLKAVKSRKKKYKRAYVHGAHTLNPDDLEAPCPNDFQYQFMTGKRDKNRNYWYGLVRAMKDPQKWANKWMSQQLHIINSNAKGGMDYEAGAFEDVTQVEKNQSKPGALTEIQPGYFEKVRRVPPAQIPPNVFELMQFAIVSLRDVTGVNVETLGTADRNQPGILEHQRKQSAMTILAPLFDSQRRYRKAAGRLTLYFIQEYLSDGRLIRIVGEGDAQYVPLTKKDGFTEYDVIVDQAPTSPNQKEAAFASIMQMLPGLMKMGIPIPPEVLDYVPGLPQKLADTWKKALTKGPSPEDTIRKLLEGMQALAEIEKTGTESEKNRAIALKDTMGIQLNTADVIGNLMVSVGQLAQGQQPGAPPAMGHNGGPPMGAPPALPPPGAPNGAPPPMMNGGPPPMSPFGQQMAPMPEMPPMAMGSPDAPMGAPAPMPPMPLGGQMAPLPAAPAPPPEQMQATPSATNDDIRARMGMAPAGPPPQVLPPEPPMQISPFAMHMQPSGPVSAFPPPPEAPEPDNSQAIVQMGADIKDGLMAFAGAIKQLTQVMVAPTELIRGADGKAIGSRRIVQV